MDKSSLINCIRVCMNDLYTLLKFCIHAYAILKSVQTKILSILYTEVNLFITLNINWENNRLPRSSNRRSIILRRRLTLDFAKTKTTLTKLLFNRNLK